MTEKAAERNKRYFTNIWAVLVALDREEYLSSVDLKYHDITRLYGFIEGLAVAYGMFDNTYLSCVAELQRYENSFFAEIN